MNWILQYIPAWNGLLALFLYWLPLAICLCAYVIRSARDFSKDRGMRASLGDRYMPRLTVGMLVARFLVSVVPIVNLVASIIDAAPEVFADFFEWMDDLFNIPLVPKRAARRE